MPRTIFALYFENDKVLVECEVDQDASGKATFCNILVTNKVTGITSEQDELEEGLLAVANVVLKASLSDEEDNG
jgi:hypothetical protein